MHLPSLRRDTATPRLPGPQANPLVGMMPRFAADPLGTLLALQRTYGDIVRIPLGLNTLHMLTHPDDIEQVLLKDARLYWKDDVTRSLNLTLGDGLLTSEGETWKRHRRLVAPALRKKQIDTYAAAMVQAATQGASRLADGQVLDVSHLAMGVTLQIVAETLFGADVHAEATEIGETIEHLMEDFVLQVRTWRWLVPQAVPLPSRVKIRREFARVDRLLRGIIAERRAQEGAAGEEERDDLLSLLLRARDEGGERLDDDALRDEAVTIFVAGHETTALNLTFTLLLLSEHPEVAAKLEAEVDGVLGGRRAQASDLPRLPYAEAVVKESLRLYPPAWTVGRQPLEDVEIAGFPLPKGAQIVLPQWVVHRDPRWYPLPERFRPERWLDGSEANLPRFAFYPFGGGPRTCVGNHFAMMEALLVLVTWTQRLRFRALSGRAPALLPAVTLRPKEGVRMRVERRRDAPEVQG